MQEMMERTLFKVQIAAAVIALMVVATSVDADADETAPAGGLYTQTARILRVINGDTVVADIDLGFRTQLHDEHHRLFAIDAPEPGTTAYDTSKHALTLRIEGEDVFLCTIKAKRSPNEKTGSFGRYLVEIYHPGIHINAWIGRRGFAKHYL